MQSSSIASFITSSSQEDDFQPQEERIRKILNEKG
jgi:hypothetical protein